MNSNLMVTVNTATQAFEVWYHKLTLQANQGFLQPSRAGNVVGEVINAITVISDPRQGIVQSSIRKMPIKYAVGELLWYLSGSNRLSDIKPYAKFWDNISDDGETLNSAYGYRIRYQFGFDQWEHAKSLLALDNNSRQAVIHIKTPDNEPSKDVPCTVALQFQIREGKLFLTTYMRSNDIWLGFPYDVFAFTCFQVKMAMELGVDVGEYTHIAGSLHLYERDVIKDGTSQNKNQGQVEK